MFIVSSSTSGLAFEALMRREQVTRMIHRIAINHLSIYASVFKWDTSYNNWELINAYM